MQSDGGVGREATALSLRRLAAGPAQKMLKILYMLPKKIGDCALVRARSSIMRRDA